MAINTSYVLIFIGYIVTLGMSAPTTTVPDLVNQVHEALIQETESLKEFTHTVLNRYKEERLGSPDFSTHRMTIIGLPEARNLSASEGDIMQTRIDDLNVFVSLLEGIEGDESELYKEDPTNFVDEIQEILVGLNRVINKAVSVIDTENLNGTSQTTYPDIMYSSIPSKTVLQFYTVKTIASAYEYLIVAQGDFNYFAGNHQ